MPGPAPQSNCAIVDRELVRADPVAQSAALVTTRERSGNPHSKGVDFRCASPARGLRWQTSDGLLAPVRCGRSNSCSACAWLAAVENGVVVALDAADSMPTLGVTLTTRDPGFDLGRFREATAQLHRGLRKGWPELQYLGFLEWTSGKHTPGRRPHMHELVKHVTPAEALDVELYVAQHWERMTGAWIVEARPLRTPAGAIAYLTHHHHKKEQAPPPGFTGKRMRPSKGYFVRPVAELRNEAREMLSDKRLRRAVVAAMDESASPDELSAAVVAAKESLRDCPPVLVRVHERLDINRSTGEVKRVATKVLGQA
jgi:hypothetical protein